MLNPGRVGANVKVQKSLGDLPYSNIFSILGKGSFDSTEWSLMSQSTKIQNLPYYNLRAGGTTAQTVYVASESTNDIVGGTGAQAVILSGLDNSYIPTQEIKLLNGQTPVASTNNYISQTESLIFSFGSLTDANTGDSIADGNIWSGVGTWSVGVPQYPLTFIQADSLDPNSREAVYLAPADKRIVLHGFVITVEDDLLSDNDCDITIAIKLFGLGENQWFKLPSFNFKGQFRYEFLTYASLPPKTEIQGRVRIKNVKAKNITLDLTLEEVALI